MNSTYNSVGTGHTLHKEVAVTTTATKRCTMDSTGSALAEALGKVLAHSTHQINISY